MAQSIRITAGFQNNDSGQQLRSEVTITAGDVEEAGRLEVDNGAGEATLAFTAGKGFALLINEADVGGNSVDVGTATGGKQIADALGPGEAVIVKLEATATQLFFNSLAAIVPVRYQIHSR